ncbi:MAG TPA: class I SAM-dependent methyltransferase [Actinomycetota bacterium]|nr:class I SAM-dependent methyltransferase [Actinomycetota bacterium]
MAGPSQGGGKRGMWESRYQERDLSQFFWYRADAPPELKKLMESEQRPASGAAIDLGCGPGVMTVYLAQYLRPAVGVDIAHAAVAKAKRLAEEQESPARFLVVEAPDLPFRSGSAGLIFDRGCLQAIPRSSWRKYFSEVERLLQPGGQLWLYCSAPTSARLLTRRGLRTLAGRVLGRKQAALGETIARHLPRSMETVEMEDRRFETPSGRTRALIYGLFRKR